MQGITGIECQDVASVIYSWVLGSRPSSAGASAGTVDGEQEERQWTDAFRRDVFLERLETLFPQL